MFLFYKITVIDDRFRPFFQIEKDEFDAGFTLENAAKSVLTRLERVPRTYTVPDETNLYRPSCVLRRYPQRLDPITGVIVDTAERSPFCLGREQEYIFSSYFHHSLLDSSL
ncbi:hypothetical protein [Collibacillus ludicampi]|uniref:hypothetical protein n=1 Tax=Collibacillus ludicampi TaxID=2771369 RepID=UPI002494D3C4|nr:hypothetical protein [Collibacillus ludicampi]